jgi:hypothetical protein
MPSFSGMAKINISPLKPMSFYWPFSKTYKHKCPDGSIKLVHKNVDDAFPLFIPGWSGNLAAGARQAELANAELKGEYATKIEGLLFGLDELNQSLMMNFRGAYVAYATDPCANADLLTRQVETLLREQHRLQVLRLQIRALVHFAASHPQDHNRIMDSFQSLVQQIGGSVIPQAAAAEIVDTREHMRTWIGDSQ